MSYDIELVHPVTKQTLETDSLHRMEGGTYCLGGSNKLHLNVTYNYAGFYYSAFKALGLQAGIRSIYGKSGAESIPILNQVAASLGDDVDDDYWKPTEGNAKAALLQLIAMATMRPDDVWDGD